MGRMLTVMSDVCESPPRLLGHAVYSVHVPVQYPAQLYRCTGTGYPCTVGVVANAGLAVHAVPRAPAMANG